MNFNNMMNTFKNTMNTKNLGYDLASHMGKMMLPTYTLNLNHVSTLNLKPLLNLNSHHLNP
jgi:hypothetical protein